MASQAEKAETFRKLHASGTFVIPNPWDIGSAKLLEAWGAKALATSSAAFAFTLGKADGDNVVSREATLANYGAIAAATDLPVSADLQGCFGRDPKVVAETIRLAGEAGLCGGSVEDAVGEILDLGLARERVAAAVEAARAMKFPFTLTARAENFLWGKKDLADTILRLQAFQEAGADVLYAPGLATEAEITSVLKSVDRPINVLVGMGAQPLTVADFTRLGARRLSVGSSLYTAAMGAFQHAARTLLEKGIVDYGKPMPFGDLQKAFAAK
ncbi:isocitrate lyase/phosphoenolpyruvate mutase family protein [Dongia sp.]|uniref:isocitrate lyase/PEP mutase family protein n=1 Tax=Dongia sp. TaxID=1977262 RepID=UPI0037521FED